MRALKGISASSVTGLRTRVVGIARPSSLHSVAAPTSASHIFAKSVKISYRQSKQSSFTTRAGAGSMMDEFEGPDAAVLMQNPDVQVATFALG